MFGADLFIEQVSENAPLLDETPARANNTETGLFDFVTKKEHRVSFALVVMVMLAQQFTGKLLPDHSSNANSSNSS